MKQNILVYKGGSDPKLAQIWIENLIKMRSLNFHPDTPAEEYINRKTHKPTFTKTEAKLLNKSLNDLFLIFGEDVYKISLLAVGLKVD